MPLRVVGILIHFEKGEQASSRTADRPDKSEIETLLAKGQPSFDFAQDVLHALHNGLP